MALAVEQRETISNGLFNLKVQTLRLGNFANISGGFTPTAAEKEKAGKRLPWVKGGELEQEFITATNEDLPQAIAKSPDDFYSSRAIRPVNTVLFAAYGGIDTVGKTAILSVPAVTNQAVCCIKPFEDAFDYNYLFCYLTYMRRRWLRSLKGSRQDLSFQIVRDLEIPHPDLKQQQEIVKKLQPYNEKIRNLKREIALLQHILRA